MKKFKKSMLIIIFVLIILCMLSSKTYAARGGLWGWYLSRGDTPAIDIDVAIGTTSYIHETDSFIENILGYLQVIGSIISVIALIIIGIRYMFSSLEEKAKMKGVMIYYIIGAVLVFATSNVLGIAYRIITSIDM